MQYNINSFAVKLLFNILLWMGLCKKFVKCIKCIKILKLGRDPFGILFLSLKNMNYFGTLIYDFNFKKMPVLSSLAPYPSARDWEQIAFYLSHIDVFLHLSNFFFFSLQTPFPSADDRNRFPYRSGFALVHFFHYRHFFGQPNSSFASHFEMLVNDDRRKQGRKLFSNKLRSWDKSELPPNACQPS